MLIMPKKDYLIGDLLVLIMPKKMIVCWGLAGADYPFGKYPFEKYPFDIPAYRTDLSSG